SPKAAGATTAPWSSQQRVSPAFVPPAVASRTQRMAARRRLRAIASFMRRISASHSVSIAKPRRLGDKAAAAAQNRTVCGMAGWTLGVIGGSGLYEIEGLQDAAWRRLESPF